jgi:SAM-dependent methyltransferase
LILDVGCGSVPHGDVNLDLFIGRSPHHGSVIDGRDYPSFIQGSANTLPIKDKAFSTVYVSHVIEHLPDTLKAVKEFKRVTKHIVVIKVPNNPMHEFPLHLYTWSLVSLKNTLAPHFTRVEVYPYTNVFNSRLFRFLENRRGLLGLFLKSISRHLRCVMGIELVAICYK